MSLNWASSVKDLLCSIGFAEVWLHQGVTSFTTFINACKLRLKDFFIHEWFGSLSSSIDASLYIRLFKTEFSPSPYMHDINICKYRLSLCAEYLHMQKS